MDRGALRQSGEIFLEEEGGRSLQGVHQIIIPCWRSAKFGEFRVETPVDKPQSASQ